MADLQKVVKLTSSQYSTLAGGGTVGSYTGLDSSYLYLVEDSTQYVPLGGTTSLYGSIVPSADNSIALGSGFHNFRSLYVNNILYPGRMSIYATTALIGGGDGGGLDIVAGNSGIVMSAKGNIELQTNSNMDLYALSGRNNIYGITGVKIWAGSLSDSFPVPRISLHLDSGYVPFIDMVANYSGNGAIRMYAPAGGATINSVPVVTGWLHNISAVLSWASGSNSQHLEYVCQLLTSTSASITTPAGFWVALKDAGYYISAQTFIGPVVWSKVAPIIPNAWFSTLKLGTFGNQGVAGVCAGVSAGVSYIFPWFLGTSTARCDYTWNRISYYTITDNVKPLYH